MSALLARAGDRFGWDGAAASRSRWARVVVLALLALACALVASAVLATPAFAATTYSNATPAPGSTIAVTNPLIKVTVADPAGINATSLIMKLDGKTVRGRLSGGVVSFQSSGLTNGVHNVEVSLLNWAGVRTPYTWSFTVSTKPLLGPLSPADGTTVSSDRPTISTQVTTAGSPITAWSMTIDGAPVAAAYDPGTRLVSYTPPAALANDQSHAVSVSVTDSNGATASIVWSFSVQIYADMVPSMTCTQCHIAYPALHDMSDCEACHGYAGPVGGFYGAPDGHPEGEAALLLQDCVSCHNGTFPTVPKHADMAITHRTSSDMAGCACHVRSLTIEHNRWTTDTGDPLSCASCHGESASQVVKDALAAGVTECTVCHTLSAQHPYGDVDHIADNGSQVDASGFYCDDCHAVDLMGEHEKPTSSSAGGECATCHPTPRDSFAAWSQGCSQSDCHAGGSATEVHANTAAAHAFGPGSDACFGSGCHSGIDLAAVHADAEATPEGETARTSCLVCHAAGVPITKDCATCHPDRVVAHGYDSAQHTAVLGSGGIALFDNHDGWMGPVGVTLPCAECHTAEIGPTHAGLCATCHPSPRSTFVAWGKNCSQGGCHTTYHASGFDHNAVASGNCSACHDEGSFRLYPTDPCVGCHAHPNAGDTTAPVTNANILSYYGGTARIYFDMTDSGKVGIGTTFRKLDGGAVAKGDMVDITVPGEHTLEYWSVDQNGNEELPHKTATFTVAPDTTPPVTTSNARSAYEGPASITLSASDASYLGVKGTYYKLNGGATVQGRTISIPQPASGTIAYTLEYWSDDYNGNTETHNIANFTVTRDITAPVSTLSSQPYYKAATVVIPYTATDGTGSGVQYRYFKIDGGQVQFLGTASGNNLVRTFSTQGPHTIEYWSADRVGNQETHRTATINVDWTAPTISSNAATSYPETGASITLTALDTPANGAGPANVAYRLDGGAQVTGPALTTVTVTDPGPHSLEFWAVDLAGNASAHQTVSFTVGTTPVGGSGTLRLTWGSAGDPPPYSWAEWTVRSGSASGPIIAQGSGDSGWSGDDWDGIDDISVPVQAEPYYVAIHWYDDYWPEYGDPTTVHFPVYVTTNGQVVVLNY